MAETSTQQQVVFKKRPLLKRLIKQRWLFLLLAPGIIYFAIFKYAPMYGVVISFQQYHPFLGVFNSPWVGFEHFERFFTGSDFWMVMRNTFILAIYNLVFFFPLPIIIALMLNEIRKQKFKRLIQSLLYIPHFLSWPVLVGIIFIFLGYQNGLFNSFIASYGFEKIPFMSSSEWFRFNIITQVMWKETGWGTIIFLAALAGTDPEQYEAATVDGAGRFRQMWHITLPQIRSTIVILFILRLGNFMESGFEQIFLQLNAFNRPVGEVFDTYVYTMGIQGGEYSFSAAVGLFKSIVGLVLVVSANYFAKKLGEEGIY